MLVTMERIQAVADKIAQQFAPDEIILFGSYAYGTPHDKSDVDLLVVLPQDAFVPDEIGAFWSKTGEDFALDIVVYDPDCAFQRALWGDFLVQEAKMRGRCLFRGENSLPADERK